MTWQSCLLFDVKAPKALYAFIFCGTVSSYNFHWFLTRQGERVSKKISFNIHNRQLHFVLSISALLASAWFAFLLIDHFHYLAITALFTFIYSAPKIPLPSFNIFRRLAIGKTIFLSLAWMHVTSGLPLLIGGLTSTTGFVFYLVNRFFFIYCICIIFDYRDREIDKKENIRSMITAFSEKGINRLFWTSFFIFLASSILLLPYFTYLEIAILLLPGVPLGLLYGYFKKHTSDFNYYFVLDGLMILSAPLMVLAKFAR